MKFKIEPLSYWNFNLLMTEIKVGDYINFSTSTPDHYEKIISITEDKIVLICMDGSREIIVSNPNEITTSRFTVMSREQSRLLDLGR